MDDRHTPTIAEFAQMLERRFRRHRAWQIGVTCLSSIVVFATVYMLVLPAVTLESSNEVPGIELLANGEQEDEQNEDDKNVEDVAGAAAGRDPLLGVPQRAGESSRALPRVQAPPLDHDPYAPFQQLVAGVVAEVVSHARSLPSVSCQLSP